MTIQYVGSRQFRMRLAEFSYTDKEEARFMKIADHLRGLGYDVDTGVENWAAIRVSDRDEYEQVLEDYKEAKKLIKR